MLSKTTFYTLIQIICNGNVINSSSLRDISDHIMWIKVNSMVKSYFCTLPFPSIVIGLKGCLGCWQTLLFVTHCLHTRHLISTVIAWFPIVWWKFIVLFFWYGVLICQCLTLLTNNMNNKLFTPRRSELKENIMWGGNWNIIQFYFLASTSFRGIFCWDDWFEWSINELFCKINKIININTKYSFFV